MENRRKKYLAKKMKMGEAQVVVHRIQFLVERNLPQKRGERIPG
jgi:uncharacterized protein YggL (DUF469 family)